MGRYSEVSTLKQKQKEELKEKIKYGVHTVLWHMFFFSLTFIYICAVIMS